MEAASKENFSLCFFNENYGENIFPVAPENFRVNRIFDFRLLCQQRALFLPHN